MLPTTTLSKLLRECFPGQEYPPQGVIEIPTDQQQGWFGELTARLNAIPRTSSRVVVDKTGERPAYATLLIEGVSSQRSPNDWFTLQFQDMESRLILYLQDTTYQRKKKPPAVPVRSIEQIEQFIAAVQARQDGNHLKKKKTEKLVGFQKKGLTARLRELGNQQNFAFTMDENARDIKLGIRIAGRKTGFHFTFVKTKLESVLVKLPELVTMLEQMQSLGLHFTKAVNPQSRPARLSPLTWIEPHSEITPVDESSDDNP